MRLTAVLAALSLAAAAPAVAQEARDWRPVAPENLLVIDTSKGRVLVELAPEAAPLHVERIRILAGQGFYDGLRFHRVIDGFMAQTGDPQGTGAGSSDLPDLPGEFAFRRGTEPAFVAVDGSDTAMQRPAGGQVGLFGSLVISTQPDAQMFVTRDGRVDASAWFCPGAAGMARGQGADSANSQFFLMRDSNFNLNGAYTVWGRVVHGLDVVRALKVGEGDNGAVLTGADVMTRVRLASELPAGERPAVEVLDVRSPRFAALVEETRAARGSRFSACDIQLPARLAE